MLEKIEKNLLILQVEMAKNCLTVRICKINIFAGKGSALVHDANMGWR